MKRISGLICIMFTTILLLSSTVSAAYQYTLSNCPHSDGCTSTYWQKKAHEGYIGNNYVCRYEVVGYYYICYEEWDCNLCGYHVSKQTIMTGGAVNIEETE